MAKTSSIQRNLKRIKLSKRFSKKRMELKKIINNKKLTLAERFAAQLKLNKLPNEPKEKLTLKMPRKLILKLVKFLNLMVNYLLGPLLLEVMEILQGKRLVKILG